MKEIRIEYFIGGLMAGAALGLVVGLLAAPQSGKKTRRQLRRKMEDAQDTISETAGAALERSREIVDRGKSVVENLAEVRK